MGEQVADGDDRDPAVLGLRPEIRQPLGDWILEIQSAALDQRHGGGRYDRLRQGREAEHRVRAHRPTGLAVRLASSAVIHDIAILRHHDDASHDATLGDCTINCAIKAQLAFVGRVFGFRGSARRGRSRNEGRDGNSTKKSAA